MRADRVAPLLERLADQPDDDETRGVLVDVWYHRVHSPSTRRASRTHGWALAKYLAPLDQVFHGVEWRAGLPYAARMLPQLPADDELLALIGNDVRLGMLVRITRDNAWIKTARVLARDARWRSVCARSIRAVRICSRR